MPIWLRQHMITATQQTITLHLGRSQAVTPSVSVCRNVEVIEAYLS